MGLLKSLSEATERTTHLVIFPSEGLVWLRSTSGAGSVPGLTNLWIKYVWLRGAAVRDAKQMCSNTVEEIVTERVMLQR